MPSDELKTFARATGATVQSHGSIPAAAAGLQCLVVSPDEHRCDLLADAAVDGGWQVWRGGDPVEAARYARRVNVSLAIVDLAHIESCELANWQRLVEALTADRERLLAVCAEADDEPTERWARQLGTWMYLPGVQAINDVAAVCAEAFEIASRRMGARCRATPAPTYRRRRRT